MPLYHPPPSCFPPQVDFNLPQRFNMTYNGADGTKQQPIMIHRAIFGSIERFFGILTENYAGLFPLWLAPTQSASSPSPTSRYCT